LSLLQNEIDPLIEMTQVNFLHEKLMENGKLLRNVLSIYSSLKSYIN